MNICEVSLGISDSSERVRRAFDYAGFKCLSCGKSDLSFQHWRGCCLYQKSDPSTCESNIL